MVDKEYDLLKKNEDVIVHEFNKSVTQYKNYKEGSQIDVNELWLSSSLAILIDDYKKITCSDSIQKKNLSFLEAAHNDFLKNTSQGVVSNIKKLKVGIVDEQKKKIELLNKKKFQLQLEIAKIQRHISKIALINF